MGRTYKARWSFIGIWLVALGIQAWYIEFTIFRLVVALFVSFCWYQLGALIDTLEAKMSMKRYIPGRDL